MLKKWAGVPVEFRVRKDSPRKSEMQFWIRTQLFTVLESQSYLPKNIQFSSSNHCWFQDFYTWKLSRLTALRSFYESNPTFVSIAYLINGYSFHAICFCYTLISYNRYLMLRNSPTLKPVWSQNTSIKVCILMILFPFSIVAHRCFFPAKYIFDESGAILITFRDSNVAIVSNFNKLEGALGVEEGVL